MSAFSIPTNNKQGGPIKVRPERLIIFLQGQALHP